MVEVLYIVDTPATIEDICYELAYYCISGTKKKYMVALAFRHESTLDIVVPLTSLNLDAVKKFRALQNTEPWCFKGLNKEELKQLWTRKWKSELDYSVVVIKSRRSTFCPHTDEPFRGEPVTGPYIRSVRPVRVFDGVFTIGDPSKPLLSVPIEMYPATRRAAAWDTVATAGSKRVTRTSEVQAEDAHERVMNAHMYLNEPVFLSNEVKDLMRGEFPGAQEWGQAFELVSTVPKIEPWIPFEKTDYLVGKDAKAKHFLSAFANALIENDMHAIVRICYPPRRKPASSTNTTADTPEDNGYLKKGKLILAVIHPASEDHIFVSPLPFKEDYRSYYRFAEIPAEKPENPELSILDDKMDDLVDSMTTEEEPTLICNSVLQRTFQYIQTKIATGESVVPPVPEIKSDLSEEKIEKADEISRQLSTLFGLSARSGQPEGSHEGLDDQGLDFEFI